MSHMSLLSICLLCWPNYRSSLFSHRRKFVAKIFRLFLFTRSWFLLGGKTPAELQHEIPTKVFGFPVSNWTNLGPCEDVKTRGQNSWNIHQRYLKECPNNIQIWSNMYTYIEKHEGCWIILTPTAPDFVGDLDVPFAGWHGARLGHPYGGTEPLPMRPLCARRCVAMGGVFLGLAWARRQVTAWWIHVFESYGWKDMRPPSSCYLVGLDHFSFSISYMG